MAKQPTAFATEVIAYCKTRLAQAGLEWEGIEAKVGVELQRTRDEERAIARERTLANQLLGFIAENPACLLATGLTTDYRSVLEVAASDLPDHGTRSRTVRTRLTESWASLIVATFERPFFCGERRSLTDEELACVAVLVGEWQTIGKKPPDPDDGRKKRPDEDAATIVKKVAANIARASKLVGKRRPAVKRVNEYRWAQWFVENRPRLEKEALARSNAELRKELGDEGYEELQRDLTRFVGQ